MKKVIKYNAVLAATVLATVLVTASKEKSRGISRNKQVVMDYMDGFNAGDHQRILACLTDDVIWEMPGVYLHSGKAAFDKEIENDAFEGRPTIQVTRLVEESDVVVAEGTVQGKRKGGDSFNAVFCDVFHMHDGKIKRLTSYLMFAGQ
ncbi:nuclear transport factor 2 family protein [Parapedobacter lycopersici]|uniref:nuclear transport factor 2 family protein n=1 Tax=Parapedobacter lycopersici TaxID=1864939 RepID=UPI003342E0FB